MPPPARTQQTDTNPSHTPGALAVHPHTHICVNAVGFNSMSSLLSSVVREMRGLQAEVSVLENGAGGGSAGAASLRQSARRSDAAVLQRIQDLTELLESAFRLTIPEPDIVMAINAAVVVPGAELPDGDHPLQLPSGAADDMALPRQLFHPAEASFDGDAALAGYLQESAHEEDGSDTAAALLRRLQLPSSAGERTQILGQFQELQQGMAELAPEEDPLVQRASRIMDKLGSLLEAAAEYDRQQQELVAEHDFRRSTLLSAVETPADLAALAASDSETVTPSSRKPKLPSSLNPNGSKSPSSKPNKRVAVAASSAVLDRPSSVPPMDRPSSTATPAGVPTHIAIMAAKSVTSPTAARGILHVSIYLKRSGLFSRLPACVEVTETKKDDVWSDAPQNGELITPYEFGVLGGLGSATARKWKAAVRVLEANSNKMSGTVGEWLTMHGL